MNQIFDRDELLRVSREGMEQTFRFYSTLNENLLKITDWQREAIVEHNTRAIEVMNKAVGEYQKNCRVVMSRIESVCREAMEKVATPKTTTHDQR